VLHGIEHLRIDNLEIIKRTCGSLKTLLSRRKSASLRFFLQLEIGAEFPVTIVAAPAPLPLFRFRYAFANSSQTIGSRTIGKRQSPPENPDPHHPPDHASCAASSVQSIGVWLNHVKQLGHHRGHPAKVPGRDRPSSFRSALPPHPTDCALRIHLFDGRSEQNVNASCSSSRQSRSNCRGYFDKSSAGPNCVGLQRSRRRPHRTALGPPAPATGALHAERHRWHQPTRL